MRRYFKLIALAAVFSVFAYILVFAGPMITKPGDGGDGGGGEGGLSTVGFLVRPSTDQLNITANSLIQVNFGTEIFDIGGNFSSNAFTAPATGKYQFNLILRLNFMYYAAQYYYVRISTSNRDYDYYIDPNFSTTLQYGYTFTISVLADMDASDIARVYIYQYSGSTMADIMSAQTWFSGFQVM